MHTEIKPPEGFKTGADYIKHLHKTDNLPANCNHLRYIRNKSWLIALEDLETRYMALDLIARMGISEYANRVCEKLYGEIEFQDIVPMIDYKKIWEELGEYVLRMRL